MKKPRLTVEQLQEKLKKYHNIDYQLECSDRYTDEIVEHLTTVMELVRRNGFRNATMWIGKNHSWISIEFSTGDPEREFWNRVSAHGVDELTKKFIPWIMNILLKIGGYNDKPQWTYGFGWV